MPQPELNFEWDPDKASSNWRKHGISFERAATVFRDREALSLYDRAHSQGEDRWITLGMDSQGQLLVVSHTWRESGAGRVRPVAASSPPAKPQRPKRGNTAAHDYES